MGVYKEGKNWKVQVYYKDWQGNQKRKQKRGFRTKGEAKEWERDFLQQQSQGVDIEFGNFLEIYYKDMDVRLREHTMYTKRYIIDLKIRPYFEKKILSEITVADVRAWQNELLMYKDKNGKGYSQTYLKTINCQLTAIFNYAIRYYNLQDNPCRKAGAIGKSKGEPKDFWMQEEFNDFLETVSDKPETRMAFLLLYWTGMRIGELLALTYDDINLEEKTMGKNSEFELINVKIVENIVDFAKNGINKDIHHMSTIGIVYGANMEKSKTIFTEYDESTLDGLENQYLRSKVKAEKVLKNAKNQGVQSSIYRMSGILFDSKTGKYQINVNESSAYIYYRNLYRLRIVPSEIQRKMDISCVDKISEAVVKLILSDDSSNDVYHVINPNGLTIKEILNCFKDCENNKDIIMKELSVEEIYNYYKKTDTKEQELFKQLVFECEIVNDIGKCDLNIGVDRTIFILEQLGFKWEKVGREEIIRAYHAIRESKKSGKKQY